MVPAIWIILGVVVLLVVYSRYNSDSNNTISFKGPVSTEYKPGFLPSHQGPWFQGMPPSLRVENSYHQCIHESGGDYGDYGQRQRCYIKTLKDGTYDKADLMCWRHRHDEKAYYNCLDGIYGQLLWADRFAGIKPCLCEDGSVGSSTSDDRCFCPTPRPLHDRSEVNQYDQVVLPATS